MIINYESSQGDFKLVDEALVDDSQNVFTVIIGKNGTGKSVMLGNIVRNFSKSQKIDWDYLSIENNRGSDYAPNIFYSGKPERVIAVSTSPFDKFPINVIRPHKRRRPANYTYLGIRDLRTTEFGNAYLSRMASNIFSNILNSISTKFSFLKVLEFLEFQREIHFSFESSIDAYQEIKNLLKILYKAKETRELLRKRNIPILNLGYYLNQDGYVSVRRLEELHQIFLKYFKNSKTLNFSIEINQLDIIAKGVNVSIFDHIVFLLESGFIRLKNTELFRKGQNIPVSLNKASSGEQSVFTSMLGIASSIRDNSIICIDEPEICLHPEWQERYIEMLTTVFEDFNACHFIIATHSPQIISHLKGKNCFILDLKNRELMSAKKVINRSADYQLAEIFGTPGFKNEYLSRIALNLFTRVSRTSSFNDKDIEDYENLVSLKDMLDTNDPVKQIIIALETLRREYA